MTLPELFVCFSLVSWVLKYRAEIDGLRALAVFPVVLFHAGFDSFSGGFVGVDVFFVISGYLITNLLLKDLEDRNFSLIDFYERRARRILPALFLVCLVCLPFALIWLMPQDLKDFSKSLLAVATFSSNILFWRESGYFATASELKPLIHTWSLAVEEQFYILFPLLLLFLSRFRKKRIQASFIIFFALSLSISIYFTPKNPWAAFYLLPSRVWELLLGSIFAAYLRKYHLQIDRKWAELGGVMGLFLIAFSIFSFDGNTKFPGVAAVFPCLGTVLIILFAQGETLVRKLLSIRPLVFIGLLSYSFYLWHQPIFAFARHRSIFELDTFSYMGLIAVSLVLSYFSWRFVEQPFRKKTFLQRTSLLRISACVLSSLFIIGLAGFFFSSNTGAVKALQATLGNEHRANFIEVYERSHEVKENRSFSDCFLTHEDIQGIKVGDVLKNCKSNEVSILLGDSHARDVFYALGNSHQSYGTWISFAEGGCRPFTTQPVCQEYYKKLLKWINTNQRNIRVLYYHQWGRHFLNSDFSINRKAVDSTFSYLGEIQSSGVEVVFLGPRHGPDLTRPQVWFSLCDDQKSKLSTRAYEVFRRSSKRVLKLDAYLSDLSQSEDIEYLSLVEALNFKFPADVTNCKELFWSDASHWTEAGELRFSSRLKKVLVGELD